MIDIFKYVALSVACYSAVRFVEYVLDFYFPIEGGE